jgi:hypothetical protein
MEEIKANRDIGNAQQMERARALAKPGGRAKALVQLKDEMLEIKSLLAELSHHKAELLM